MFTHSSMKSNLFLLLTIWCAFLSGTKNIHAQVNSTASPAGSALGAIQSAEVPVDMFTGTATVNIPLYTIQSRGGSLPISLSYNTSGVKVRQLGTSVGLGWNLNVGGMISRDVRGTPDEYMTFYYATYKCKSENSGNWSTYYQNTYFPESICQDIDKDLTVKGYIKGRLFPENQIGNNPDYWNNDIRTRDDQEADIFYLNSGSINAKFILKPNGEVEMLSAADVKIKYNKGFDQHSPYRRNGILEHFVRHFGEDRYDIASFEVTAPDGFKYYFEAVERIMTGRRKDDNYRERGHFFGPDVEMNEYPINWKLTKIVDPENNVLVSLNYTKELIQTPDVFYMNLKPDIHEYQNSLLFGYRINSIEWGGDNILSKAIFTYDKERDDLEKKTHSNWPFAGEIAARKAKLLTDFRIYVAKEQTFENYNQKFIFSYTDKTTTFDNNTQKRHFLNKIELEGKNSVASKKIDYYKFEYDQKELSHIDKYNEDFWGYNVNPSVVNNGYKFPKSYYYPDDQNTNKLLKRSASIFKRQSYSGIEELNGDLDRNPDENYISAGILNKITTASGATTDLQYEIHDFIDPEVPNFTSNEFKLCKSNIPGNACLSSDQQVVTVATGKTKVLSYSSSYTNIYMIKNGTFCFGSISGQSPPPQCTVNLNQTGSSHYIDLQLPGTDNHYASKKLQIVLDYAYQNFDQYSRIEIKANGTTIAEINKTNATDNNGIFEFELPINTLNVSFVAFSPMTSAIAQCTYVITSIPKKHNILKYYKSGTYQGSFSFDDPDGGITLGEGSYAFIVENIPGLYLSNLSQKVEVTFTENELKSVPGNIRILKGGGLRIKSVTTNDGQNSITREYKYITSGNVSSGRLLYQPEFFFKDTFLVNVPPIYDRWRMIYASTQPMNGDQADNPANVAYQCIEEVISGKGKTVYTYNLSNNPLVNIEYTDENGKLIPMPETKINNGLLPQKKYMASMFSPMPNLSSRKGQLLKVEAYNNSGAKLLEETHKYQCLKVYKIKNIEKGYYIYGKIEWSDQGQSNEYEKTYYHFGFDDRLIETRTIKYDANGNENKTTQTIEYRSLGNIIQPKKITTILGDGITLVDENILVADMSGGVYTTLQQQNRIYLPVENKSYVNGQQVKGERLTYASFNAGGITRVLPKYLENWTFNQYVQTKEMLAYTKWAEPLQEKDVIRNKTSVYTYKPFSALWTSSFNGRTATYDYYDDRSLKSKTTADGVTMTYEYDPLSRVGKVVDDKTGYEATYQYEINASGSKVTSNVKQLSYIYPQKISEYSAGGEVVVETVKNANGVGGDIVSSKQVNFANSKITTSSTDAYADVTEELEPSLSPAWKKIRRGSWPGVWKEEYGFYSGTGKTTSFDPDGNKTESFTDGLGRSTVVKRYDNTTAVATSYTYDAFGRVLTMTQPNGQQFSYSYAFDGTYLKKTAYVPGGGSSESKTDLRGLLTWSKDERNNEFTYEYDDHERISKVNMNGSVIKQYTYNESGIIIDKLKSKSVKLLDGSNGSVDEAYTYDNNGRPSTTVVTVMGNTVSTAYYYTTDNALNYTIVTTSGSLVGSHTVRTDYVYDGVHRVKEESITIDASPKERIVKYEYDAQGNVKTKYLGQGNIGTSIQKVDYKRNGIGWLIAINDIRDCSLESTVNSNGDASTNFQGNVKIKFNSGSVGGPASGSGGVFKTSGTITAVQAGVPQFSYDKDEYWYTDNTTTPPAIYSDSLSYMISGQPSAPTLSGMMIQDIKTKVQSNGGNWNTEVQDKLTTQINQYLDGFIGPNCANTENDAFAEQILYNQSLTQINPLHQPHLNGLISAVSWRVGNRMQIPTYAMMYDGLGRLVNAKYKEKSLSSSTNQPPTWIKPNAYDETISYADYAGNISNITRQGYLSSGSYGQVDNIYMSYSGNRMTGATDYSSATKGWQTYGSGVSYDNAGNITQYGAKGITNIVYNFLNLPNTIYSSKGTYTAVYDADGRLWKYTVAPNVGNTLVRGYLGGWESLNGTAIAYNHGQGRHVLKDESTTVWVGEYVIADHLGNTRVIVKDKNGDGKINLDGAQSTWEIISEKHFYPFGMPMEGEWITPPDVDKMCRDGFNGMEYIEAMELDMYITTFRIQDPGIGRWLQIDPYASEFPEFSPYLSMCNNPVSITDPKGDYAIIDDLIAIGLGGAINLISNALQGNVSSFQDGLIYFGIGVLAGEATLYGGPLAGAGVSGALNSLYSQGRSNDGRDFSFDNVSVESVILNTITSVATSYAGGILGNAISPYTIGIFDKVVSPVLRNALEQGTGNAIVGGTIGFVTGSGLNGALKGIGQGFALGFMTGSVNGYMEARYYERNPWTGKLNKPVEDVQTLPTIQAEALRIKNELNNGRNSVTISDNFGKIRYDLDGAAHGNTNTPHKQFYKNNYKRGNLKSTSRYSKMAYPLNIRDINRINNSYNPNWKIDGWLSPWLKG